MFTLTMLAGLLLAGSVFGVFEKDTLVTFEQAVQPVTSSAVEPEATLYTGKPVRLTIASIGIDIDVADGVYDASSQTWTLTNTNAHYALMTPPANNLKGNTFIYGHNRKQVFASLKNVQVGDTAIVTTAEGHTFTYIFASSFETTPTDDSLFRYEGPSLLTLQTCSGLWYQNRQLFTFTFSSVEPKRVI